MIYNQTDIIFFDDDVMPLAVDVEYDFSSIKEVQHEMGEFIPESNGELQKKDIQVDEIINTKKNKDVTRNKQLF